MPTSSKKITIQIQRKSTLRKRALQVFITCGSTPQQNATSSACRSGHNTGCITCCACFNACLKHAVTSNATVLDVHATAGMQCQRSQPSLFTSRLHHVSHFSDFLQVRRHNSIKAAKEMISIVLDFLPRTFTRYTASCPWVGAPCALPQMGDGYCHLLRDVQGDNAGVAQVLASSKARLHKQGKDVSDNMMRSILQTSLALESKCK